MQFFWIHLFMFVSMCCIDVCMYVCMDTHTYTYLLFKHKGSPLLPAFCKHFIRSSVFSSYFHDCCSMYESWIHIFLCVDIKAVSTCWSNNAVVYILEARSQTQHFLTNGSVTTHISKILICTIAKPLTRKVLFADSLTLLLCAYHLEDSIFSGQNGIQKRDT